MEFTLTIMLGNEAMQTGVEIADALRKVADHVQNVGYGTSDIEGKIRDENGNTVGSYQTIET